MSYESSSPEQILPQEDALKKAHNVHLANLEQAINNGFNHEAYQYFGNLYRHLTKYKKIYDFNDEESGIDLKSIGKKVADFLLNWGRKYKKKSGAVENIKWLNEILADIGLTYQDIGTTEIEIETFKPGS
ncbi:MAG: hypothetical protein WCV73_05045 [Patescibacteria group bacterium]|jgi:hypothetical protein